MNASAHTGHKPAETDLFGDTTRRRKPAGRVDIPTPRQGHAAWPGTGPEGEQCGGCARYSPLDGERQPFPKCRTMLAYWANGAGTDIKPEDPACREFAANARALAHLQGGEA